jgi:MFS family permease
MAESVDLEDGKNRKLFWCCFVALVATSFGFIVRAFSIGDWGREFGLTATQQGEIFGVGLWPFAISIVLFSLIIDRIGYRNALIFAFVCHVVSAIVTITATGYWSLYVGTFIVAIANGTVEAVINPVVATMFKKDKTKWLNILHAGWPAGLVLGGLLAIAMGPEASWKYKIALIYIPTLVYGVMMIGLKFPVNERVAAGVPYKDMLRETGGLGALIVLSLITFEIGRVFQFPLALSIGIIVVLTAIFTAYTKDLGRPLFILLLLLMIPLATTELGTDSWITALMEPEMKAIGLNAGWIIVYTSAVMMVLRFFAGPIVHKISPLGLLAASSAIATVGLNFLSSAHGITILLAATLYAFGKTFFWPTMLGVVAERFPKGGALTLNATGGVGMLGVGVVGSVFLGAIQDRAVDQSLMAHDVAHGTQLHGTLTTEKTSIFGSYRAIDQAKLAQAAPTEKAAVEDAEAGSKKGALRTVSVFPFIMLITYLALIGYFRARGGYKPVELVTHSGDSPPNPGTA